jgi:hypothetical protein
VSVSHFAAVKMIVGLEGCCRTTSFWVERRGWISWARIRWRKFISKGEEMGEDVERMGVYLIALRKLSIRGT